VLYKKLESQKVSKTKIEALLRKRMQNLNGEAQALKNEYKQKREIKEFIEKYRKVTSEICRCEIILKNMN